MNVRRTVVAVAGTFTLVAILILPGTSADAAATYEVSVGQFLATAPAESMRFLPETINVHQGDTLHFTTGGFHTATILPVGSGPVEWYDSNATFRTNQPYALIQPDTEDTPNTFKFGNGAIFQSDPTCGGSSQPACSYDGSTVQNSGAPFFAPMDWTVSVGAAPDTSFYVICLVHGPNMRMKVNVVQDAVPASDPTVLARQNARAITQDSNTAAAVNAKYSTRQTWHVAANGRRVWDAWAGVDTRHLALYAMYPHVLHVRKGDAVQWHFDSLYFENHTVSFPSDRARQIANGGGIACDPDTDAGPLPDGPPTGPPPDFCTDPAAREFHLDHRFVPKLGDGQVSGPNDLESSGVRGASGLDGNYKLRFAAATGATGARYICLIHPFMRGKVVVG